MVVLAKGRAPRHAHLNVRKWIHGQIPEWTRGRIRALGMNPRNPVGYSACLRVRNLRAMKPVHHKVIKAIKVRADIKTIRELRAGIRKTTLVIMGLNRGAIRLVAVCHPSLLPMCLRMNALALFLGQVGAAMLPIWIHAKSKTV